MKTIKRFFIFMGTFLLYHIIFSSFFTVDENNVLQAPDWYVYLGFGISATAALFFTDPKKFHRTKRPVDTSISFEEDLASVQSRFSEATAELARNANEEVKIAAKLDAPKLRSTALSITIDEFSRYGGTNAALLSIDLMEGHAFEQWCAEALRNSGFVDVEVTPGSGDQGVDVLARKDGIKYAIQCKCYSSNLGNTPIQEVNAGKFFYHCHVGAVMTNQYFTPKARELAEATGTLLWDRDWIKAHLDLHPADTNSAAQTAPVDHISVQNSSAGEVIIDEMLPTCVDVILETEQASVAMIQRRTKLGYARASRIMDLMEELGIVGPNAGSKPRNILITKEQWAEIRPHIQNLK